MSLLAFLGFSFFSFFALTGVSAQTQTSAVALNFTISPSTVVIGQPFKAKCELLNFTPTDAPYQVLFYRNYRVIANFTTIAKKTTIQLNPDKIFQIEIHPLSVFTLTSFEIFLVKRWPESYNYSCLLAGVGNASVLSAQLTPPVEKAPTSVAFSVNVTEIEPETPFTGKCVISNYDAFRRNYTVRFLRTSGWLGNYEIQDALHSSILFTQAEATPGISIHHGAHSIYLTFYVEMKLLCNSSDAFWCEFHDDVTPGTVIKSNNWLAAEPVLTFNVTKNVSGPGFKSVNGLCAFSTKTFNYKEAREYKVNFFSDKALLGFYQVKIYEPVQFIAGKSTNSKIKVVSGASSTFPHFEISVNSTAPEKLELWCQLETYPVHSKYNSKHVTA